MEERSQVRELDRDRGRHDPLVPAVAETGGQQHKHGPEPLAAGFHHVPGNLGEHLVPAERGISQGCLYRGRPGQDRDRCRRTVSAAVTFTSGIQRTNNWVAAWLARFSNGWGTMPRTIVASRPSPTALPINRPGTTTSGPSGTGSLKNMSTMMRT